MFKSVVCVVAMSYNVRTNNRGSKSSDREQQMLAKYPKLLANTHWNHEDSNIATQKWSTNNDYKVKCGHSSMNERE